MTRVFGRFALATTALMLVAAPIHSAPAQKAARLVSEDASLRPGQFVWQPELSS